MHSGFLRFLLIQFFIITIYYSSIIINKYNENSIAEISKNKLVYFVESE